jgi:hypothetical protein
LARLVMRVFEDCGHDPELTAIRVARLFD